MSIDNRFFRKPLALALASISIALTLPVAVQAQDKAADALEEIVVTGTRKKGVSPTETLSPVDMIGGQLMERQAGFDLTDSLSKVSPAINTQRFPIADGTALIRPVTLRNLSPDHTLVLIDGSRRHRSALVNLQLAPLGTVNQGSQAVDWAAFPGAAVQRVEVLRDGASAQYGSDAIAGVINVILKDANEGATISAQYGEYQKNNDGERVSVSANAGFPLTENGFVNVTGEYSTSERTWRGNARPDAAAIAAIPGLEGQVPLDGLGQRWGDPDIEAKKFLVNSGIDISDHVELYGFGTYMDNTTESDFFYRRPVLIPPVDGLSPRSTLEANGGAPADQSLVDSITGQGLNPADYLVGDANSPSGFILRNPIYTKFPGGYNPTFGADLKDYEMVLGARGEIVTNLTWDLKGRYGENEVDYKIAGSINPSLGSLSPLDFHPGTLTQEESGINAEFVKSFENSPLNIAFGAEARNETYKIGAGDQASIEAGPTAAIFGVGSDGFQGFPTESAGDFSSDSWAAYIDVETDLTDKLSAAVAARYEDYKEFGNTFDWKLSARYELMDGFALRATANTGFRAPTPGQVNTLNVTTTADSSGNLIPSGTYPVSHPVALAHGSQPLDPETSNSYTFGVVLSPSDDTSITADYYHIEIDDRLALINYKISAAEVATLTAAGIPNAALLLGSNAGYFANGYDSEVKGIDLSINTNYEVADGTLNVDLRHNFNEQTVSGVKPGTIDGSRVYDLENQTPNNSSVLTFDWTNGSMLDFLVRFNYYDEWSSTGGLFGPGDASDQYNYDDSILVDLEANFTFAEHYTVSVGGDNILDKYPAKEQEPTLRFLGVEDALTSPYGFNGAFWYMRASVNF